MSTNLPNTPSAGSPPIQPTTPTPETDLEIERLRLRVAIWEKTVDTQMHFNEMSVKARQLGLSFVVAALGVSVVLLSQPEPLLIIVQLGGLVFGTHVAGLVIVMTALALFSVSLLDLNVYHKMLRGAVAFGEELEHKHIVPEITHTEKGLTLAVSHFSRSRNARIILGANQSDPARYVSGKAGTAAFKIARFYVVSIVAILVIGVLVCAVFWTTEPRKYSNELGKCCGRHAIGRFRCVRLER